MAHVAEPTHPILNAARPRSGESGEYDPAGIERASLDATVSAAARSVERVTEPTRARPSFPEGYGLPTTDEGLLDWAQVRERLVASKHYWLATVRPDGRPHVIPRWGVWVDDHFYYDGAPTTRHARNLAANTNASLHLEDGWQAVMLDGVSEPARADADGLGARLSEAFRKYHDDGYSPAPDAWAGEDGGDCASSPQDRDGLVPLPDGCDALHVLTSERQDGAMPCPWSRSPCPRRSVPG